MKNQTEEHFKTTGTNLQKVRSSSTNIIPQPTDKLAHKSKELVKQVMPVMNLPTNNDKELFLKALERFEVTEKELNDAFWGSYADPYVPASGIEFRHLYKHIEKSRHGSGEKLYSYNEMLHIVHKEKITTDHFEFIKETKQWKRK